MLELTLTSTADLSWPSSAIGLVLLGISTGELAAEFLPDMALAVEETELNTLTVEWFMHTLTRTRSNLYTSWQRERLWVLTCDQLW